MNFVLKAVLVSLAALLAVSCSNGNEKTSLIDPATGKHVAGWAVANTGGAHPTAFLADSNVCFECHGADLKGGVSKISCFTASRSGITCHANGPGAPHSVPFPDHGATAISNFNFCLGCHQDAANATGSKPPGCQNCHLTSPVTTPSGCTSCHANPPAGAAAAYPNIAGTHSPHINASKITVMTLTCSDCHSGLGLGTVDHQVRAKARTATGRSNPVVFSSGTLLVAGGGTASSFNDTNDQCSNVYCHGAKMPGGDTTGSNRTPTWGTTLLPATISAAACGICHGFPPAAASGHPPVTIPAGFPATPLGTTCSCHANINTQSATATTYANVFADLTKHINGIVEVTSPHPFPNPGSAHVAATNGTGCRSIGCHPADVAGSPYPVGSGTPPNCRACHLNNSPTVFPRCSDCHGSSANDGAAVELAGKPNGGVGSVFPNRLGRHDVTEHLLFRCTICHSITDNDPSHGWSGGIKSSAARIKILTQAEVNSGVLGITSVPGAGQCTANCHNPQTVIRTWLP